MDHPSVEATTWRTKEKAQQDIAKLVKLYKKVTAKSRPAQAWFVTQSEPTADQRAVAPKDGSVRVLSFEQFRAQLVDAHGYLRDRDKYAFGSARDPSSGAIEVKEKYIPLTMISRGSASAAVEDVVEAVDRAGRVVVLGDYGAGKSMTLREVFAGLASRFRKGTTASFPIHLNLRDHHAQRNPAEALERHGRNLGFAEPSQLVRAWRAGYAHLLLDGFDEMATPGWVGPTTRMRDIRRRSVELVRQMIRETPTGAGIVVAGRDHYFDSSAEMTDALGVGPPFIQYRLGEFSGDQIEEYLKARGWAKGLPDWLPARPLLLAYLANRGLLQQALDVQAGSSPAMA
ncbi:MAG: NACHT domain-containing protein [Actinomycetota bacterium]|nr:NACHT domain-containing protein [Actinomycetota bacterium]